MSDAPKRIFTLHERLVRGLLHRGSQFVSPSPTGDWRGGPVGLLRPPEPDRDAPERYWLVVPPLGPGFGLNHTLPPEIRSRAAVAILSDAPPLGTIEALERAADLPTVVVAAGLVGGGPAAEASGAREEVVRTLAYRDADLERVDPDARYAAMFEAAADYEHMARLRAAMPHAWATIALVVLCVLTFLAQLATSGGQGIGTVGVWGANQGVRSLSDQPWRLLTSGFLHGGTLHLAINMWILWDLGQVCERLFGRAAYLGVYLTAILGGSLASAAWTPLGLSVGASGGIFGLAGALLALVAVHRDLLPKATLARLGRSVGIFVVANLAFGSALGAALRIDNSAHVGGLLAGAAAGAVLGGTGGSTARLLPRLGSVGLCLALLFGAAQAAPTVARAASVDDLSGVVTRIETLDRASGGLTRSDVAAIRAELDAVVAAGAAERPGLQPAIAALNEFLDSLDAVWALPRAATPAKRAADETALIRRARDAFGRAQAEVRVLRQALGG